MDREPDITGRAARAWQVTYDRDGDPRVDSHVGTWIIEGPFHPFWSQWAMTIIELKEVEGMPPPNRKYPEADAEFLIVSLNPDHPAETTVNPQLRFLEPPDVAFQCDGLDREQLEALLRGCVDDVVEGRISPDSDYRQTWLELLSKRSLALR